MTRRSNSAAEHLAREYGNVLDGSGDEQNQPRRRRRQRRPKNRYKAGFSHEKALIYGVVQCLAGVAFVVLGVVSVATSAWGYEYGCGLWSGALCLAAGVFGLASSRCKTNKTITTFMISSAMAATAALITLSISSVGIVADHSLFDEVDMSSYSSALVVHSLSIVVSIVAAFCGAMAAIVGCRGVCGGWYGADDLPTDNAHDIYTQPPNNFLPGVYSDDIDHMPMPNYPNLAPGVGMPGARNSPLLGSGYQQIAIVPPGGHGQSTTAETDDPSGRMIIMQSSGPGNQGLSQVMYILQAGAPCPQPGQPAPESADNIHSSPPPSYSTLALDVLSRSGDSHHLDPDRTSGSASENGSETPHDLSSYSYDISCPSNITNIILQDLCRRTNNPQQRVYLSSSNRNANSSSNPSANAQLNDSHDTDPHGDDYYALREGETSFSSEWSNSHQASATSPNPPDSITDQDLPLLEASPQRYRPREQSNTNQNEESLMTYI